MYADVEAVAQEKSIDMRTAAFALGIRRVVRAGTSRRALREAIDIR